MRRGPPMRPVASVSLGHRALLAFLDIARRTEPSERAVATAIGAKFQNLARARATGGVSVDRVAEWVDAWNASGRPAVSLCVTVSVDDTDRAK